MQHDRSGRCFGQFKTLLHHVRHVVQFGPGVEQPHLGFHGEGVGAFLHDGRAFTVVLPDDDERAALDPGGSDVSQGIRGHVGADGGFPGHRAAQRVIDGGGQHGGRRGLAGGLFEVYVQFFQDLSGIGKDVD